MSDFRGLRWTLVQSLWSGVLLYVLQFTGICIASVKMSSLNRTQEDYVLLSPELKIGNETLFIKWYFQSKNLCLLTIWSGESSPRWIIPQKEYKGRLSAPYGESLKITDLTPKDTGCYEYHAISVSGEIHIEKFNLTVFESNTNPCIQWRLAAALASVLMLLLVAVWYFLHKVKDCLCRIQGIFKRESIQPVMPLSDERGLEEGSSACSNGFYSDQETN